jgi:transcription elongation factor GreA
MSRVKLTRAGERKLFEELRHLKEEKRPEAIDAIAEARRKGDLSENAEYDAAKMAQHILETKIHMLEAKLKNSEIIEDRNIDDDKVYIGARVELEDMVKGGEIYYILVDEYEADFSLRKISTVSPIGKSLLGKAVGETVEVTVPRGILLYRIKNITR